MALYALHHDMVKAQAMVQAAVDAVELWSSAKKLTQNVAKSVSSPIILVRDQLLINDKVDALHLLARIQSRI